MRGGRNRLTGTEIDVRPDEIARGKIGRDERMGSCLEVVEALKKDPPGGREKKKTTARSNSTGNPSPQPGANRPHRPTCRGGVIHTLHTTRIKIRRARLRGRTTRNVR